MKSRRRVNSAVMRRTLSLEMKSVATALICFAGVAAFATEPDVIWHKFEELTKRPRTRTNCGSTR